MESKIVKKIVKVVKVVIKKEKNVEEDEEIADFGLIRTAKSELDKAKKFMQNKFNNFKDDTDREFGKKILKPSTFDDKGKKKMNHYETIKQIKVLKVREALDVLYFNVLVLGFSYKKLPHG